MSFRSIALACALMLAPGAALADTTATASLAAPVAAKTIVEAGRVLFSCEGDKCVAIGDTSQLSASWSCVAIAKQAGAVSAFAVNGKPFDAAELEKCNARAKK